MKLTPAAQGRLKVEIPVLVVTAAAWVALAAQARGSGLMGSCCIPASIWDGLSPSSLGALMARNPPASLTLGWALMLVAMMAPLMSGCIRHVMDRSFARRRARAVLLLLAGYIGVWMIVGAIILPIALIARLFAPTSYVPALAGALIALIWQSSPLKQRCLNRAHSHPNLAAFGKAADRDVLRFGINHGGWCVGSCWSLMLVTELLPVGHLPAMALVTVWLAAEHLERPATPQWGLRGVAKAVRITIAQSRSAHAGGTGVKG